MEGGVLACKMWFHLYVIDKNIFVSKSLKVTYTSFHCHKISWISGQSLYCNVENFDILFICDSRDLIEHASYYVRQYSSWSHRSLNLPFVYRRREVYEVGSCTEDSF